MTNYPANPDRVAVRSLVFTGATADVQHMTTPGGSATFCGVDRGETRNYMRHAEQSTCTACVAGSADDREAIAWDRFIGAAGARG